MTYSAEEIREAEKRVTALVESDEWQRAIRQSDMRVSETLETLRQESSVDPRLLDEPATL